ncbi:MAG: M48 family metalloprotease [Desulfobacterales bacterium]|nr:M48 family metalloprotease [Desulfobacterales bacterium]
MNDLIFHNNITRRQFIRHSLYTGISLTGISLLPILSGCAVNPVTGKNQFMMVTRDQEISIDNSQSPHQFSADYGVYQNSKLNQYISRVGKKLTANVHRSDMPYRFKCVNATYINAYAFPGGSIAVTRGILLEFDNEAELAALLGHELGHVNARHSAQQMSKGSLASLLVGGLSIAAGLKSDSAGEIAQQLGMLSQGMLLSYYSRDNEREADSLGNEYMVKAGYPSKGFVGLMHMLNSMHKKKPSTVEVLFSTHPMSSERYDEAVKKEDTKYTYSKNYPLNKDKYMDNIAPLRKMKPAIKQMQEGDAYIMKKQYSKAQDSYQKALKNAGNDYTANIMMAKCLLIQEKPLKALRYTKKASRIYKSEVQAYHLSGMANLKLKKFNTAYNQFEKYENHLPGNPHIIFFKGFSQEGMKQTENAANNYKKYLNLVQQGENAEHAYNSLKKWGYIK